MLAATEGRSRILRAAIGWVCLALLWAVVLSFYKSTAMSEITRSSAESLRSRHSAILNLFQGNYYFYYEEKFLPGIRSQLAEIRNLRRIQIYAPEGGQLFDSLDPARKSQPAPDAEVTEKLALEKPSILVDGYEIRILMPGQQYGALYTLDASFVRRHVALAFFLGLLVLVVLTIFARRYVLDVAEGGPGAELPFRILRLLDPRMRGLRSKFLLTIVTINALTGGIVFFTVTQLQVREQTQRIERDSLLFSQFSTDKVISDFTNYFYFYYRDKFMPEVKKLVSTNENLLSLRIVSRRTGAVLFDSERAAAEPSQVPGGEVARAEYSEELEAELKSKDLASRHLVRGGEQLLSVVTTYRNESREPLFYVEYLYSFSSLQRNIRAIRRQILIDLVPSMALGILIALAFAQFLLNPIRRLLRAFRQVSAGDYNVKVESRTGDELGELVGAFNSMTQELKKKKELRKFLSGSTYDQVMKGAVGGGSRVRATLLFSDIRNFVSHCEALDAEEVTSMLNDYFSEMVEVVNRHGGDVDKFIGDAILAVFYSSEEPRGIRPQDAETWPTPAQTALSAIHCALEMRERLAEFNKRRVFVGKPTLEIGVGITYGEIISGPIGAKDRMDFTVIGDPVNVANRIEKLSKQGKHTKIVFSDRVEEMVRGVLDYRELTHEKLKGKAEEVTVFEVIAIKDLRELTAHLEGSDLDLKLNAIETLGHSRNPEAIPYLLGLLGSSEERVRLRAGRAISHVAAPDQPEVVDALVARLRKETSPKVVSVLIAAMGGICTDERILELARFLDSADDRIVANAVEAMGQVRSPRCTDLILPKLGSRNNRIKANAAMALFAAGRTSVIDTLKPMLMHSDPAMRASAAFAIGEVTLIVPREKLLEDWQTKSSDVKVFLAELQECVPMLVSLLKDPDLMVKRQSVIALGKIKDKSSVLPLFDSVDIGRDSKELIHEIAEALRSIGSHKLAREVIERLSR